MKDKSKLRVNEAIVRFTDDEFMLVRWQAKNLNLSVSQFVRFSTVKTIAEIREAGTLPDGFVY